MLVWVLKPKNLNLAGLLHLRGPVLVGRFHLVDAGDGVDEEQVHVVRLQPFQTLIQAFGQVAALGLVNLGDQEDLLPGLGVAGEEAAVCPPRSGRCRRIRPCPSR